MKTKSRWLVVVFVLALIAAACTNSGEDETTTTAAPETTTTTLGTTTTAASETTTTAASETTTTVAGGGEEDEHIARSLVAPVASITVDGDPSDWAAVPGLATTLEPIVEEQAEGFANHDVVVKMAHDDENVYVLYAVDDDYNFNADDPHLTGSAAFLFPVDTGGPHMGGDDEAGENSTGMVDIWHWELECASGTASGGALNGADSGNDPACNFDDEWASDSETREDDDMENSLVGQWTHSNPTEDSAGMWYFEVSRPLDTGDPQDAIFAADGSTQIALAYWDPDNGPEGWKGDEHVQSANQGWIDVTFG